LVLEGLGTAGHKLSAQLLRESRRIMVAVYTSRYNVREGGYLLKWIVVDAVLASDTCR